jgi:uracil-DNA glycosylase family 4
MEDFDGCELKKVANKMVFGDGNPESKIMVIGEAPGADEDREGIPFVGASGKLLDQMLSSIGLTRTNYYITNIIPWRPPGNRDPTPEEREICMPFVERRIELIQPKVIVMVGGVAAKSLLGVATGITGMRGQWHTYKTPVMNTTVDAFAIYHPSYLLRSPGQKRVVWKDLLLLKQKLMESGLL